jgi:hypothetical protein
VVLTLSVQGPSQRGKAGWGFSLRGPGTTVVLVVRADCSLERS